MNLHECDGKKLFAEYGLPVSKGVVCTSAEQVIAATDQIGGERWVVKAQVHAGGRGKAGGVKLVSSKDEAAAFATQWLGKNLVTFQTDENGQPVHKILVESCTDIENELYLSAVVDRTSRRITFIASTEGGMDIEEVAASEPEKILNTIIDPVVGAQPYQGRAIGFKLGLNPTQIKQFTKILSVFARMFEERDLSLLEVNPLVITTEGNLHCLDAKVVVDDSALYRQPALKEMDDPSQDDPRERKALEFDLNYVALDGNIGCMVNGAGLAMATMDLVKFHGGEPANFLDVGGGATQERVSEAFKLILSDSNVKGVFVNIFGGIVRCDMIAEGIMAAVEQVGVTVPVVVRLQGNNAELGLKMLSESGMNIMPVDDFTQAALRIVAEVESSNSRVKETAQ